MGIDKNKTNADGKGNASGYWKLCLECFTPNFKNNTLGYRMLGFKDKATADSNPDYKPVTTGVGLLKGVNFPWTELADGESETVIKDVLRKYAYNAIHADAESGTIALENGESFQLHDGTPNI